jgi:hypothetical protein
MYTYIHTHKHTILYIHTQRDHRRSFPALLHTKEGIHTYIHTYIHACTCIYIHTHTQYYTYINRETDAAAFQRSYNELRALVDIPGKYVTMNTLKGTPSKHLAHTGQAQSSPRAKSSIQNQNTAAAVSRDKMTQNMRSEVALEPPKNSVRDSARHAEEGDTSGDYPSKVVGNEVNMPDAAVGDTHSDAAQTQTRKNAQHACDKLGLDDTHVRQQEGAHGDGDRASNHVMKNSGSDSESVLRPLVHGSGSESPSAHDNMQRSESESERAAQNNSSAHVNSDSGVHMIGGVGLNVSRNVHANNDEYDAQHRSKHAYVGDGKHNRVIHNDEDDHNDRRNMQDAKHNGHGDLPDENAKTHNNHDNHNNNNGGKGHNDDNNVHHGGAHKNHYAPGARISGSDYDSDTDAKYGGEIPRTLNGDYSAKKETDDKDWRETSDDHHAAGVSVLSESELLYQRNIHGLGSESEGIKGSVSTSAYHMSNTLNVSLGSGSTLGSGNTLGSGSTLGSGNTLGSGMESLPSATMNNVHHASITERSSGSNNINSAFSAGRGRVKAPEELEDEEGLNHASSVGTRGGAASAADMNTISSMNANSSNVLSLGRALVKTQEDDDDDDDDDDDIDVEEYGRNARMRNLSPVFEEERGACVCVCAYV